MDENGEHYYEQEVVEEGEGNGNVEMMGEGEEEYQDAEGYEYQYYVDENGNKIVMEGDEQMVQEGRLDDGEEEGEEE